MGGETYRPSERSGRSPPRSDTYRTNRSPPRRGRTPPSVADNYVPGAGRSTARPRSRSPGRYQRRSRSPALRGRDGGSYRGRPRSPMRGYSPRRDERDRSPPPRARRDSRSPFGGPGRERSLVPLKRTRERSPIEHRRPRSPPLVKRGRYASPPRERFERDAAPRFPRENNYRPRELSRTPPVRRSEHASRRESPVSSRRSSPPIHPDRMVNAGSGTHSPAFANPRHAPPVMRSPSYRGRSPRHERERSPPRRAYSPVPRSPPNGPPGYRDRSPPPRRERDQTRNGGTPNTWSSNQVSSTPGLSYRNGDGNSSRAPPSGPGGPRYNDPYSRESPSGPPSAPISMSAHNRPSSSSLLTAPTRPRGGPSSFGREGSRESLYGGPPPRRGPPPSHFHGPSRQSSYDARSGDVPTGPRGSYQNSNPAPFESRPPFRPNNSSSTTYPRTQRFSQHLNNVPAIVPGGKLLPSGLDPQAEKRLAQLEEDKKKLLEAIEEKQKQKRAGLREWDKAERESAREGLKSELAEGHLDRMTGEGGMGGSAF